MTRDEFLAKKHNGFPVHEKLTVPGLGEVLIKKLNAGEKDRFESDNKNTIKNGTYRARTVVFSVMDERGIMLFDESDIPELCQLDPDILDPIVRLAAKLNGYTEEDQEELRKNSNGQAETS